MAQQSTKDYLISIAQHLLQQNCQNQAYTKYKRIKATLMKKQQKQLKLTENQKSLDRLSKTKFNKQLSQNIKQRSLTNSYSLSLITNQRKILSPSVTNKKPTEKSINKQQKNKSTNVFFNGSQKIDFNKESSNKKSKQKTKNGQPLNTTGRKSQSSLMRKKKLFDSSNQVQNLIQTKMKGLIKNEGSNKKQKQTVKKGDEKNHIDSKILKHRIDDKNIIGNSSISLNINLNKLLLTIEAYLNQQILSKSQMKKSRLILSQQNIKLLKTINKKLDQYSQFQSLQSITRPSIVFKKQKTTQIQNTEQVKDTIIKSRKQKQCDLNQNQKQNQNLFSFVQISTPKKYNFPIQQISQKHTPLSPINTNINTTIEPHYITKDQQLQTLKKSFIQQQTKMTQTIYQLKKDNKWLVQNLQNLLNQNQQLKTIILHNRSNIRTK